MGNGVNVFYTFKPKKGRARPLGSADQLGNRREVFVAVPVTDSKFESPNVRNMFHMG